LSLETNLAIVKGTASENLPALLRARGGELGDEATKGARLAARIGGYALVLVLSVVSFAGVVQRLHSPFEAPPASEEKELLDQLQNLLDGKPGK
jgi:hypothetical protein